jgi:valyl-tRNA synthetase
MAGYEFKGQKPFSNVYLTGIVRDKLGRKMSKSLGNSPDPFELIEKYSADGMRVGMLLSSPAGNDLLFDEKYCEQGRNFANKIWNAFRLVKGWEVAPPNPQANEQIAIQWFKNKFNQAFAEIEDNYEKFRLSEALGGIYKLVWDDFCSWYLEMIKPEFGQPITKDIYDQTIVFFENILKVIHPFMPFISEEIWHELKERRERECIIVADYPRIEKYDTRFLDQSQAVLQLITQIRNYRSSKGKSPKETLVFTAKQLKDTGLKTIIIQFEKIIDKLANTKIEFSENPEGNAVFIVGDFEFYLPVDKNQDIEKEKQELKKEIEYLEGFLKSVNAKLNNEKFVANAKPEVIENEKKKQKDAETKIASIKRTLEKLN